MDTPEKKVLTGDDNPVVTTDPIEEKDLTGEDGNLQPEDYDQLESAGPPQKPYNFAKKQEKVRGLIAQGLIVMLAIIILLAFISLWYFGSSFADLEKLMTIIFGPVIALVGTAIGYYFGGKSAQNGDGQTKQ